MLPLLANAHWSVRLTHDAVRARCHFGHLRCQLLAIYEHESSRTLMRIRAYKRICLWPKALWLIADLEPGPFSLGQSDAVAGNDDDDDDSRWRMSDGEWRMSVGGWRWRESLEPKGQATRLKKCKLHKINCQVCLGNAEINWATTKKKRNNNNCEQTTKFVAQQIGNKFEYSCRL